MTRRVRRLLSPWLVASTLATASAHAAESWGGAIVLTSDSVFRGVSQTDAGPAAQLDLHARFAGAGFVGAWVSTVKPPPSHVPGREVDLYVGFNRALSSRWDATVSVVRYLHPDAPRDSRYDSSELSASLRMDDRLVLSAAVSPDSNRYSYRGWSERGLTRSYEASLRQPLFARFSIVASIGHYDTRALLGESYRAWNAGLSTSAGPVELALLRFGVDAAARRLFGRDASEGRWVFTASWRF